MALKFDHLQPSINCDFTAKFLKIVFFILTSNLITDCAGDVCYEYRGQHIYEFHCSDGCCGSTTDAYCCTSPAVYVGIGVAALAGLIMIVAFTLVCYQKKKARELNKVKKISIGSEGQAQDQSKLKELNKKDAPTGAKVSQGIGGSTSGPPNPFFVSSAYPPVNTGISAHPPSTAPGNPAFPPSAGNPAYPPSTSGNPVMPIYPTSGLPGSSQPSIRPDNLYNHPAPLRARFNAPLPPLPPINPKDNK